MRPTDEAEAGKKEFRLALAAKKSNGRVGRVKRRKEEKYEKKEEKRKNRLTHERVHVRSTVYLIDRSRNLLVAIDHSNRLVLPFSIR